MIARSMSQFQPYLESIRITYKKWWQLYTLTDAAGKQRQAKDVSPTFDFGLMVQMVKREEREHRDEEKVEKLPVLEGIRKYADQHVLLVGRPGSGKSTALARLLLEEATTPQAKIPVLVELRYWQSSIEQLILKSFARHGLPLTVEQLETVFSKSLILFDGVNELPSEEARSQLSGFRRNHPNLPMIFTTRDLSIGGDLEIEKKLEMQPLTEAQMQDFVRSYVPEQAEEMLRQLKDRLREFGQTPLLLWMLCGLFQQTGEIPENLGLVFRLFTQGYERNLKQDVVIESDREWWKHVLQQLAWVMMQGEKPTEFRVAIGREEAVGAIAQFLNGKVAYAEDFARKCLRDLQKHHLIQAGTNMAELEFRHQLIQEYYAAEALLEQLPELSDEVLKREYLNYLKWTEPVALMLGLVERETLALQVVELALQVDLILGARMAGKAKPRFHTQTIALINNLGAFSDLQIELLITTRSERMVPSLFKALQDVLHDEARELHPSIHQRAIDQKLYERTIRVLGQLDSKEILPKMIEVLQDKSSKLRAVAIQTLGHLGSEAALPELVKALHHDVDSFVRSCAADALGRLRYEVAFLELLPALEFDESPHVRGAAAYGLGTLSKETAGTLSKEAAVSGLIKALRDSSTWVRRSAVDAISKLGDETATLELIELAYDEDPNVRSAVVRALRILNSKVALQKLLKALDDVDAGVRRNAVEALGELKNEMAIPSLLQALQDENYSVRAATALALGNLGSEVAIPELIEALDDIAPDVRGVAAGALGKLKSESAILKLLEALGDEDHSVRADAAEALGKLGNEVVIPELIKTLQDKHERVRGAALQALFQLNSEAAIPILLQALQDFDLLYFAATALEKIGKPDVLPYIWQQYAMLKPHLLLDTITAIQRRSKLYNHDIYQQSRSLPSSQKLEGEIAIARSTIQIERLTIMTDKAPIFNQQNATIGVNYAAEGSKQDFTQYISATEQNFEVLLTSYKQFIDELQQENLNLTDETEITKTIDVEARRIDARWQNFLNLKRLWNGSKKAAVKVGEHFVESNPWGKGAIAFLEGVSEDVK